MQTALSAAAVLLGAATPLLAHDGDLKYLHRQPAHRGTGYQNALLKSPNALRDGGPNMELGMGGFPANGVTLLAWVSLEDFGVPPGGNGNSLTGYTSPGGRKYALMGLSSGTAFVDVTTPNAPVIVGQLVGPESLWRDVRAYGDYAYAVSEGGSGIQIFDMSQIDSGTVTPVGNISDDGISSTHTLEINQDTGYLYRAGGQSQTGLRIYDLNANPTNPPRVGTWNDRYVHEVSLFNYDSGPFAGREIAFACGGFNGGFDSTALHVLDVTNKNNIVTLDIASYPGAEYCHQGWLSEDGQYFYINDELFNGPNTTQVMNVSDLNNVSFAGSFSNGNSSVAHNLYIYDGHMYSASYKSGLRVWDLSNALNPTEVRWFDTVPEDDAPTFNGLWNNYPYFGNGLVIGSDLEKGLFVWYVGDPQLTIAFQAGPPSQLSPSGQAETVLISELQPGDYVAGSAMLHVDTGSGFVSVPLADNGDGSFIANFPATTCGSTARYYVSADAAAGVTWTDPPGAPAVLHEAFSGSGLTMILADDFESDQGWSVSDFGGLTAGSWERGVPADGDRGDPPTDADGSGQCYVTENVAGNSDVDNGTTVLTSPVFDLSEGALISYDYWLADISTGPLGAEDSMVIEMSTDGGSSWQVLRTYTTALNSWRSDTIDVGGEIAATSTMRLRVSVSDLSPGDVVEGGFDSFRIDQVECGVGTAFCFGDGTEAACPCGNSGDPGHGCDNSAGTGGVELTASGDPGSNSVVITGTGYPPAGSPTAIVIRATIPADVPALFGDGLLCIGTPVVRLSAATAAGGSSTHPLNHGAGPGSFHYQLWYRNTGAFCTPSVFNTSNAYSILWP